MSSVPKGFVTEWCEDSKGATGGYDKDLMFGTRALFLLILVLLEFGVIYHILMNTLKRYSSAPIDSKLKWCLWIYHICLQLWLIVQFSGYAVTMFSGNDFNNLYWCYSSQNINFFLPSIFLPVLIVFWNLRLNTVFEHSTFKVSKCHNKFMYGILIVSTSVVIVLIFTGIGLVSTGDPDDFFCVGSSRVIDFIPFLGPDKSWTGESLDLFRTCETKGSFTVSSAGILIGGGLSPLLNSIIAFQYIRKMYKLYAGMINNSRTSDTVWKMRAVSPTVGSASSTTTARGPNWDSNPNLSPSVEIPDITRAPTASVSDSKPSQLSQPSISEQPTQESQQAAGVNAQLKVPPIGIKFQRSKSENDVEKKFRRKRRTQVYKNGAIAVTSSLSTLFAYMLYAALGDTNLSLLLWFDSFINGVLMIAVFQFGNWVFEILCLKCCGLCCDVDKWFEAAPARPNSASSRSAGSSAKKFSS